MRIATFETFAADTIKRVLAFFRRRFAGDPPPGSPRDPYAWKPAPLKPRPNVLSGAVALKEPDSDSDG
jgi:hypothetical protein